MALKSNLKSNLVQLSLFNNKLLMAILIFSYLMVYGVTAQFVLSGLQLAFFLCSFFFAATIFYIREPEIRKTKAEKGILFNQVVGTAIIFVYAILFGISSVTLLKGLQLIFFMSSYTFAMSIFYIEDKKLSQNNGNISASSTTNSFFEKNPCFINSNDLSWLVRELNGSLTTILGFTELMLTRKYSEYEKEYMIRNIYEQSILMSYSINKVSSITPDDVVKPKEIYEVVDLLDDKNFKPIS